MNNHISHKILGNLGYCFKIIWIKKGAVFFIHGSLLTFRTFKKSMHVWSDYPFYIKKIDIQVDWVSMNDVHLVNARKLLTDPYCWILSKSICVSIISNKVVFVERRSSVPWPPTKNVKKGISMICFYGSLQCLYQRW